MKKLALIIVNDSPLAPETSQTYKLLSNTFTTIDATAKQL